MACTPLVPLLLISLCVLSWNHNTELDLDGYHIYSATASHSYVKGQYKADLDLTTALCEQLGITMDGLIHYFAVTAYDLHGLESAFSQEVSIQMLNQPCTKYNRTGKCMKWG